MYTLNVSCLKADCLQLLWGVVDLYSFGSFGKQTMSVEVAGESKTYSSPTNIFERKWFCRILGYWGNNENGISLCVGTEIEKTKRCMPSGGYALYPLYLHYLCPNWILLFVLSKENQTHVNREHF